MDHPGALGGEEVDVSPQPSPKHARLLAATSKVSCNHYKYFLFETDKAIGKRPRCTLGEHFHYWYKYLPLGHA